MAKRGLCLLLALAAVFSLCVPTLADEGSTKEPVETDGPAGTENDPEPSASPEPSGTPEPSASPESSGTPGPSASPEPSGTPAPSASPESSGTPAPAASPEPVAPAKLPAPKLLKAENTGEGIAVAWEAVPGAAWYRVYYRTAGGSWAKAGDADGTSYIWTRGKAGTAYDITVKAYDDDGAAGSYDDTGLTVTCYLATPELSGAKWSGSKVTVSWGRVTGAVRYRVYYRTAGGSWTKAGDTTGTSYTWTKGKAGTVYSFTVRCMDGAGKEKVSGYDEMGVTPANAEAPKLTGAANAAGGVQIKWKAVPGAAKYRVFYKNGNNWKKIADTDQTSYTWAGAESGERYTFTVRCVSADGKSYTTNYDAAGVTAVYIAVPELTGAVNTASGVKVSWNKVPGAAKYRVFYKTTGSWKKLADTAGNSYTWTKAESGTEYAFTVRCLSADGKSYATTYDKAGVSVLCIAAPEIANLSNTADGVKVTWNGVAGASRYRVYYKTGTKGWTKVGETTKTSYEWTGAESGAKYIFTVKAFDANGVAGPYNKTGKAITHLSVPVLGQVSSEAEGLQIQWEEMPGAEGYRVFYKTTGGWKKLADTDETSYTWTTAESGLEYAFTVRCVSADRKTYTSAYDTAGMRIHYIATPVIDETANVDGGIKVNWDKIKGAARYQVYYKTGEDGEWELLGDTAKTSCSLTEPDSKAKYTFRVQASAKDGTLSGFSEERKSMIFTNSPLATFVKISPNQDPDRNNIIDTITIHCTAGQGYVETFGGMFAKPSKKASSNYGIGKDGRIGMFVEEKDCSWCSSNRPNDNRAITIEVSSDDREPYWVTSAAYNALIDLVTDICQRNGIEKLVWSYDANVRINHLNGCNMTCHRDFYNKSCPGTYLYTHEEAIAAEVNARLGATPSEP